jgi:hypothetical protein
MREDEFARYAERVRQLADGHERIVFGINHTRQLVRPALGVYPASHSALRRAPRGVTPPSREAIIARWAAVSVPVRSTVGFLSTVVALEFSVQSPTGDS